MSSSVRALAVAGLLLVLGVPTAFTRGRQATQSRGDLTNPAAFTETAPATYLAQFDTSIGTFVIRVTRSWAPNGADRFYNLVKAGFYDECRFFRVVPNHVAQFGIHGDPAVTAAWNQAPIPPDRARMSNTRGRVSFAMSGPTKRSTQVFINFADNSKLDVEGFAAFGEVITSMVMVERLFNQYGEGPDPMRLFTEGNAFLLKHMPQLDYVKTATILEK